jgi:nitroreductase
MELMNVLASRRSVRSYTRQLVERSLIDQLLRAAVLAPSGMNDQPWAFGVVEGAERLEALSTRAKRRLLETLEHMPALEKYREHLEDPAFNIFYGAPALAIIYTKPTGYDGAGACAMAAYAFMLAARDLGLGTCWIGFSEPLLQSAELKRELGVPCDYRVVAPIILGYPAAAVDPTPRNEPEILFWQQR